VRVEKIESSVGKEQKEKLNLKTKYFWFERKRTK